MMRTGKSHAGRVNLTKYVKVRGAASETWRFCPVVYTSNGRIRPDYVLIEGRPRTPQRRCLLHRVVSRWQTISRIGGQESKRSVCRCRAQSSSSQEPGARDRDRRRTETNRNHPVGGLPRVPRGNSPTPQAEDVQPVQDRSRILRPVVS